MFREEICYGIVLVSGDRSICSLVTKSGDHIQIKTLGDIDTKLQKRQKKGGQSAPRFGRIRQEKEDIYVNKVADMVCKSYMKNNNTEYAVTGILIGGPANLKNRVREHPLVVQYLDKIILKVIDTTEIHDGLVNDIYDTNEYIFMQNDEKESVTVLDKIKDLMRVADDKLLFGFQEIVDEMKACMVASVIISEGIPEVQKEEIRKLNTYGCTITEIKKGLMKGLGIDIVGIRFY